MLTRLEKKYDYFAVHASQTTPGLMPEPVDEQKQKTLQTCQLMLPPLTESQIILYVMISMIIVQIWPLI